MAKVTKRSLTPKQFAENLTKKWGEDILSDFERVLNNSMTFAEISEKYSFSPTYAGVIFKRLNGNKSLKDFKRRGWVRDHKGKKFEYTPSEKSKSFVLIMPGELHYRLKKYSMELNVSMATVVNDAIASYLDKKLIRKFFPSLRK